MSKLKQMVAYALAWHSLPPTSKEAIVPFTPAKAAAAMEALASKSKSSPHFYLLVPFIIGFITDCLSFLFTEASKKFKDTGTSLPIIQESSAHKLRKSPWQPIFPQPVMVAYLKVVVPLAKTLLAPESPSAVSRMSYFLSNFLELSQYFS